MNLENEYERKQLSLQLKTDIDNWCADHFDDGPRSHLGASEIGHNCSRYLVYKNRWAFYKKHEGRMGRLLHRGHDEEEKVNKFLRGINCHVKSFDKVLLWHPESECLYYGPEEDCAEGYVNNVEGIEEFENKAKQLGIWLDKGKRQIRISDCKGHFGGSLDAEIYLPTQYHVLDKCLGEYKTIGVGKQGKNFEKLTTQGVKLYKPVHWAQQCVYGFKRNLKYSLYITVNKNDDDLHIELIKLDWNFGADLIRKAEMIIFCTELPNGIGASSAYYECKFCDAREVCHNNADVLVNCRSCKMSEPVDDAQWFCHKWNSIIPTKEAIIAGCSEWVSFF